MNEQQIALSLKPHEAQAIAFLYAAVEHETDLSAEGGLAAGLVFCELAKRGLIEQPVFPVARLTPLGVKVFDHLDEVDA